MLQLLLDAVVLISLLKMFNDDEMGLLSACFTAFLFAVLTAVLSLIGVAVMGLAGLFVGLAISAGLIGLIVSAMFGIDVRRSILIAGIFIVCHVGVGMGLSAMVG